MPNGKIAVYNSQAIGTTSGVLAIDNLVAENIKSGVNVGGVVGTYEGSTKIGSFTPTTTSGSYTIAGITELPKQIFITMREGVKKISDTNYTYDQNSAFAIFTMPIQNDYIYFAHFYSSSTHQLVYWVRHSKPVKYEDWQSMKITNEGLALYLNGISGSFFTANKTYDYTLIY